MLRKCSALEAVTKTGTVGSDLDLGSVAKATETKYTAQQRRGAPRAPQAR